MKIALIVLLVLVALAAAAGGFMWYSMSRPLYRPGKVAASEGLRAPLDPPAQAVDAPTWRVEPDVELAHFSQGEGRNVLVVHGGPGYPYTQPWPGLEPLAGHYRFHYYDQRGCGESTRPIDTFQSANYGQNVQSLDRALGIGAQLADMERIRRILGEEKLILIGHSFGGFLASLYAAEFPHHVEALILIAPADVLVMPQPDGGLFEMVRGRLPDEMQAEYDAYLKSYFDYRDLFSKSEADLVALNDAFARYYTAAIDMPAMEQGRSGGWMVQGLYFSMGRRHDYRPLLQGVSAPVLVIHGTEDLQAQARSQVYADAFANGRLETIAGAGHFPFATHPDAFAAAIQAFLDKL